MRNEYFGDYMTVAVFFIAGLLLVAAAIFTAMPDSSVDILLGIGGAPEGVLAAAAMRCMGGNLQARLVFRNDQERKRAIEMGLDEPGRILNLDDLAAGNDILFVATGITSGDLLMGVRFCKGGCDTHSLVMRSMSRTIRFIETKHSFQD